MDRKLILPSRLMPGDRIGIAAPASHFGRKALQEGVEIIETSGYQVDLGPQLFARHGYLAGRDEVRAADLHRLFRDPQIKAIFCARGGYGTMRLLPYLDWALIRDHPKIFLGFSDITVLLNLFCQRSGMITYHGPLVTELGQISEESRSALFHALSTSEDLILRPISGAVLQSGRAEGGLAGGNLTLLCSLLGTPYEPRIEGHLLFIEDRGEVLYRIDRMLWQLKLAGWFQRIRGLILGHFTDCGEMEAIHELVADLTRGSGIPVMAGFGIGHEDPNQTLPIGNRAALDTARGELWIQGT
jgi:muramoyltetrapeptide carboxypeptidase